MKAIITAAGLGSRLLPHTSDRPKCMVEVCGVPLLQFAVDRLRAVGVSDVVVVGGYRAESIQVPGVTLELNTRFATTNVLASFFAARRHLVGDLLLLYSDVLVEAALLTALIRRARVGDSDVVLAVDRDWRAAYQDRLLHPVSEAELVAVREGRVAAAGKYVEPREAYGEWCGAAHFSARGTEAAVARYEDLERAYHRSGGNPFPHARSFEQAYVTDLLTDLVARGAIVRACGVRGGWMEIDTPEDLARAEAAGGCPRPFFPPGEDGD